MHNPGPDYESVEFRRSPAYREMQEALAAHGFDSYLAMIAAPMAAQRAFHEDWSERMRQRAEIAPRHVPDATPAHASEPVAPLLDIPRAKGGRNGADHTAVWTAIATLHAEGLSTDAIARALGRDHSGVRRHMRRLGLTHNAVTRRAEAKRMKKSGRSTREIADALGVHVSTVYDLLSPESDAQRRARYRQMGQRTMQRHREAA